MECAEYLTKHYKIVILRKKTKNFGHWRAYEEKYKIVIFGHNKNVLFPIKNAMFVNGKAKIGILANFQKQITQV